MSDPLFASGDREVARVALPVPVDALFDYAVPDRLARQAVVGCRVLVPFRERRLAGVVLERAGRSDFSGALRPIEKVLDTEPALSPAMLGILREAAAQVLCPIGLAVAAALPPGAAPRSASGFALTPRGHAAVQSGALRGAPASLLATLREGPRSAAWLRGRLAADAAGTLRTLERDGLVAPQRLDLAPAGRGARERLIGPAPGLQLDAALAQLGRAPKQAALLRALARSGETPLAALGAQFSSRIAHELVARGLATLRERARSHDVLGDTRVEAHIPTLTPDQADALKPIEDAIAARRCETFLLHGVTGSGKTEIYLRAVAAALRGGRQALVLVPEIPLTHQILGRLRGRFGDDLAVLHSGLRAPERLEQWQRLRNGSTAIAVGARSALFAPLENLGVIVIDEEHDGAYKNEEGFRYHARDLAALRAASAGCPLVLGSATPSLEMRFAADRGALRRLVLPRRIGRRPLPAVEIVDLASERAQAPRGRKLILTRLLRRAMREALEAGGQTILFLNRRGFATQVFCFECGHAERCADCDIALVYHASDQVLRCHYCDHRRAPPETCSGCGAPGTALLGLGTQRLEEEVRIHFPAARIARLDRDSAARRGFAKRVLDDLRERRVDILIGTQMVAKGHDFPGVQLVGVVAADVGLHMPDFRAAERTFQLLTQVAGRAGRDATPGRVVVQTFVPAHYAIAPVRDHDYERFYEEELGYRAALGFPPFGHLAQVLVSGPDAAAVERGAATLADAFDRSEARAEGCERLGPAPAPLARLRGRHRHQLLVKGPLEAVRRATRRLADALPTLPEGVQGSVDAFPLSML
ncbi:MAG: primosomal protein N' [Myxococcales bacterium]|nr:primosomal protein N' [Myxococcales bacterium]